MYTITEPTHEDIDGIVDMHAASWAEAYPSPENGVSETWVAERTKQMRSADGRQKRRKFVDEALADPEVLYLVAKDKNRVVGFVDAKRGADAELRGLYIESTAYGSGLASELGAKALEWVGNTSEVKLTVVSYNQRAQSFYRKLGFEMVDNSERPYKDTPLKVVDMVRKGVNNEI